MKIKSKIHYLGERNSILPGQMAEQLAVEVDVKNVTYGGGGGGGGAAGQALLFALDDLYSQKYGHDGYPWKDNRKTKSPVKKSSDLYVFVKSYDQQMDLDLKKYQKNQKWPQNQHFSDKIKILRPLLFLHL